MFPFTGWFGCFNGLFVGEGRFNGLGGRKRQFGIFIGLGGLGVLVDLVGGLDSFYVLGS